MRGGVELEPKIVRGAVVLLACFACVSAGCSRGPGMVQVTGVVTVDGAPPPGPGTVYFTPHEPAEGYTKRPGYAEFDVDGKYVVRTSEPGDGITPGSYRIRIDMWSEPWVMGRTSPTNLTPAKYQSAETSELELVVAPRSRPIDFPIDIVSKQ